MADKASIPRLHRFNTKVITDYKGDKVIVTDGYCSKCGICKDSRAMDKPCKP